jgi:transposase InsO family protein
MQFGNLWRQKDVKFDIEIDGPTLNILAEDEGIGMPVRLKRRSTGFRWYVSFAWKFTHATNGEFKDCVLLLEEPGVHLHFTGQRDLLKVFERLAEHNTILYTTHLASMVDQAQARTTPAVRAEIARSTEPASVVAKRYGISDETVRKWRRRGEQAIQDRSSRPNRLAWRMTEEERAIICAVRRATGFALDDLTFVLRHFLPHLNRDNIYRVLKAEGLNRRPPKAVEQPRKGQGRFKDCDLGFVHIDVKHLPKLRTADGEIRKRFLYVAIDRCSRFVHLAVYDAENAANAIAFLKEARKGFPFRITHVLTDRGSCFTADDFELACTQIKVSHRMTKPYTPQTNGMVERFNGRIASEVLGINVGGHADLEILLAGFNRAYNQRRQRVLEGLSPHQRAEERIRLMPSLANPLYKPPAPDDLMSKVDDILYYANDVSQPDS